MPARGCSISWHRCSAHADAALCIDFRTLQIEEVPLRWTAGG